MNGLPLQPDRLHMPLLPAVAAKPLQGGPECSAVASSRLSVRDPLRQLRLVALKEFSDRLRSGWVVACILVWLGAIGLTSFFGLLQIGRIGAQGFERTVISLLNLVQFLVPLLGLLLGHDLLVNEAEEHTVRLLLAGGLSRTRLLLGKFVGGCITLGVPLVLGFAIAGAVVGVSARDSSPAPFLRLALSGLALGIVFLGIGLLISAVSRTRVQALVLALVTWCLSLFVFDLVALAVFVSAKSPAAAREIEVICDATHVNAAADLHSSFELAPSSKPMASEEPAISSIGWLALNPVDLFRAVNLEKQLGFRFPAWVAILDYSLLLAMALTASAWKLTRSDL